VSFWRMNADAPASAPFAAARSLGLSDDEFSPPIAVASIKPLWTNLKTQLPKRDAYSLETKCHWVAASADKCPRRSLVRTTTGSPPIPCCQPKMRHRR
jgi:hypothetical protein